MRFLKPLLTVAVLGAIVYALYVFVVFPFFFHYVKLVHIARADAVITWDSKKLSRVELIGIDANPPCPKTPLLLANKYFHDERDVRLINDSDLADRDEKGAILRYVFLKNSDIYNEKILGDGFAREFQTSKKYRYKDRFDKAQEQANKDRLGVWGPNGCPQ